MELELTTPHHITVGYTGVPGDRTFFLQAEDLEARVTLLLEKGQVEGLGELLGQLLTRVGDEPATDWDHDAMALRDPIDPRFRVGQIGFGFDPDGERFVLELTELTPEQDEDEDEDEGDQLRVWLDRDQARRLAAHAMEVVAQGRPRCELCGRPTAAGGEHVCPSSNGHGRLTR
jgi:uncharacterized repeat protein (TIGR03847 family)